MSRGIKNDSVSPVGNAVLEVKRVSCGISFRNRPHIPCLSCFPQLITGAEPQLLTDSAPIWGNGLETVRETVCSETSRRSPVISVGYGRSRWQIRPFTPSTGVQIPLGTPNEITALQKRFLIGVCCLQIHVYKMPRGVPACGAFPFPAAARLQAQYYSLPERPS